MARGRRFRCRRPLAILLVVGLVVVYSGAYNIAATEEHASVTRWAFDALDPLGAESAARIVSASEMLSGANVPTLDPHTMMDAEIEKVIGRGPLCLFRYTSAGAPVFAFDPPGAAGEGVVKLNGSLIRLAVEAGDGTIALRDGLVVFALAPEGEPDALGERVEATLVFEVEDRLRVGYGGYYECREAPGPQSS